MGEPLVDGYGSCATCSQMGRTNMYRLLGGFDARFRRCEDSDLAIRLALVGGHFVGVPDALVIQRMTPSSDKSLDQIRAFTLLLLEKHQGFFDDNLLYEFCRGWVCLKFDWLANKRVPFAMRLISLALGHPVLTARRLIMAAPNLSGNRAFSRFHAGSH